MSAYLSKEAPKETEIIENSGNMIDDDNDNDSEMKEVDHEFSIGKLHHKPDAIGETNKDFEESKGF